MSEPPLTLGTAGHVDHGKTALISALTGTDTDRLPQERERGISIELGYARLVLPSGRAVSVVDAPGHERFVRTMVAGATGVDLFLMVIAADDGVMPQTREHAAVLRALGIEAGVVAVTKRDLADPTRAMAQAAELLPGVATVPVSVRTGAGVEELRQALESVCRRLGSRAEHEGVVRLHVDRVFSIRGAGTVVTGTLWSGMVARGDALEILPGGGTARVRSVQVHDRDVASAEAGQRVALNLAGVARGDVPRGSVLTSPDGGLQRSFVIDAALDLGPDAPAHGDRVQVHHGTRESPARLAWLGGRFWQVRLEQPLVPAAGDRIVVRRIAPPDTLGGGSVLDPRARKHGPSRDALARLERLARGEPAEPPIAGPPKPVPAPAGPASLSPAQVELECRLLAAGLEPPLDSELDRGDLAALRAAGRAVRVGSSLHYHPDALAAARARIVALAQRNGGSVTLAGVRDELGTSRKFAQPLLQHLDATRVTIRSGDEHRLRRSARTDGGRGEHA